MTFKLTALLGAATFTLVACASTGSQDPAPDNGIAFPVKDSGPVIPKRPYAEKNNKGMTFAIRKWGPYNNYLMVGCNTTNDVHQCNPYGGDQVCSARLPVLCFRPGEQVRPRYIKTSPYAQWSSGSVALSRSKVRADTFKTTADVDAFCAAQWGKGWRAADFHDGSKHPGWNFWARSISDMPDASQANRFWANISDQPNGTCWENDANKNMENPPIVKPPTG